MNDPGLKLWLMNVKWFKKRRLPNGYVETAESSGSLMGKLRLTGSLSEGVRLAYQFHKSSYACLNWPHQLNFNFFLGSRPKTENAQFK